jgi:3-vinyl bacteriochlorophyllide hydratase
MAGTVSTAPHSRGTPLYTPDQRRRRDASRWTVVQGVLAPVQLLVCLASIALVARYLANGEGWAIAAASVVLKTVLLYAIMVTGSLWEHDVYGQYLFAPAFFWEDVVSFVVLALHTAYLAAWAFAWLAPRELAWLALAAYATYLVNAAQFLWKLRTARRDAQRATAPMGVTA